MGVISKLLAGSFRADAGRSPTDDYWYQPVGSMSLTGLRVDSTTALKLSTVWACVNLISETIAALPLVVYHRLQGGGKERATTHPLYELLHDTPNRWQSSLEWRQQMTMQMLLSGNAYAEIVAGPHGFADQLVPLDQARLTWPGTAGDPYVLRESGKPPRELPWSSVFRLRGPSLDGLTGLSVLECAREAMGIGLAAEQYAGRVYSQDARPRGTLEHPGKLSKDAAKRLSDTWHESYAGLGNAHRVAVLEEGMKFNSISVSPEDAQMIASREFSVEDICRWFRVPPHMVGSTAKVTSWGSGIEQLSIGFVTFTLLPWLRRWEQAISAQLIAAPQWYFAEHVVDGLVRGDISSRYAAYLVGRQGKWLNANEVRGFENLNPIPGGDVYENPLITTPDNAAGPAASDQTAEMLAAIYGRTNGHA